ncbi:molybdopterin cofactor-binding domain-containing protein [Niveispirillum fermenti]|uniref:xanthine dehydrogenase family protein molybdopterin-binding subunit n=1 Tax=Niveispirillum fermenti TaxID=1233113 RepID=UPI003A85CD6A
MTIDDKASPTAPALSRRILLAGAGGLLLGLALGRAGPAVAVGRAGDADTPFAAWMNIAPDGAITIATPAAEMGQGIFTSLPKILIDELGGDWSRVTIVNSDGNPAFNNPASRGQTTGQSISVRGYYPLLRKLGAQAREMLRQAAAAQWKTTADRVRIENGYAIDDITGRRLNIGLLVQAASSLPIPADPPLKPRDQFTLIGKSIPAKDAADKVTGRAVYAGDMKLPGLLTATVRMSPVFGGRIRHYDPAPALAVPGVVAVVPFGGQVLDTPYPYEAGIAVVAENFWAARKGYDALDVTFEGGRDATASTAALAAARPELARTGHAIQALAQGDVDEAWAQAVQRLDCFYDAPFLAHMTMEPMSCVAHVEAGKATLWAPTQGPLVVARVVGQLLDLPAEQVTVHRTFLGGGFGRRWPRDFAVQAAEIARAVGRPVKLIWTREEDMQHGFYRPGMGLRARISLDAQRRLTGMHLTAVGPSLMSWQRALTGPPRADFAAVGGLNDMQYSLPALKVDWVDQPTPIPIGMWRGVGHSQNGFFAESLIDEIAHAGGLDPYRFRREMLASHPRSVRVLDKAADAIGWGRALPPGKGMGIAFMESYGTLVAHAALVHVTEGKARIERLVAAVDPGLAVDPGTIEAQMQGAAIFALSALYHGEITVTDGKVDQTSFTDQPILTLAETPPMEVHILESEGVAMGGIGEPGLPTVAPAVTNAIFAATGIRVRSLPLARAGLA